jgi:hypothetical protein
MFNRKIKNIAVCFSGQCRTWRTAKENILKYYNLETDVNVDFFIHTWDINQYRSKDDIIWQNRLDEPVSSTELDELIFNFNPKGIELEKYNKDEYSTIWSALLYSFKKSIWLKRQYEIKNDFRYDLVIKTRLDVNYPQLGLCNLQFPLNKFYLHPIQNMTGYSTTPIINKFPSEFNYNCFDDVMFYSNSLTMDIIAGCQSWYENIIKKENYRHQQGKFIKDTTFWYGPGTILYKYLVSVGIHPQGYRAIPYYIVRNEVEKLKLNSIENWDDIRDYSHEWYDALLNNKQTNSVLKKYKKKLI